MEIMQKGIRTSEFNKWMVEAHQMVNNLNEAFKLLQKWGYGEITQPSLEDLLNTPKAFCKKYLSHKIISREFYKHYDMKQDNRNNSKYEEYQFAINRELCKVETTIKAINDIKSFLYSHGLLVSNMFKICNNKVIESPEVEHYYFSINGEYTQSDEEERVLLSLQNICGIIQNLSKYKITPNSLQELIVKNSSDEYEINVKKFNELIDIIID